MIYNSYQIAEIIGVNVSTVKRWTDSGKLKCSQTVGGHRKFHLNDLKEFLTTNKKFTASVNTNLLVGKNHTLHEAIATMDFTYMGTYLYQALRKNNEDKFSSLINSLILEDYSYPSIFDNLIIPLLHRLGDEWINKKLSISEEHMITEILKKFLSSINFQYKATETRYNAFCFTMENDEHSLPLYMAETVLNNINVIKTYNLGANLPIEDFLNLSKKVDVDIIFISIIYFEDKDLVKSQIKKLCKELSSNDTHIFFKGAGINLIKPKKNIHVLESFEEFHSILINDYGKIQLT